MSYVGTLARQSLARAVALFVVAFAGLAASTVSAQIFIIQDSTGKDNIIDISKKKDGPKELKLSFWHGGVSFKGVSFSAVVKLQRSQLTKTQLWDLELTTGEKLQVYLELPIYVTGLATVGTLQDDYGMPISQITAFIGEKSSLFAELKARLTK